MSLLGELKRRNVIRVAGVYLVTAWLLVQVASILLPAFDSPPWVMRALVLLLALGFVPTLVFSWLYELTPEGIRRDGEVPHSPELQQRTLRKLDLAIIVLLLASLALLAWNRFHPAASRVDAAPETAIAALGPHSIAVLPFESFSAAEDDARFADGLADTVLHKLAQLRQLRVIARNSSFSYKGSNVDVRKVGNELGVASVLEGSVQRQDERLRVIAQLIETRSGSHLWSQTYDRPVADLFAIQDEIAAAVVKALQVELLAGEAEALSSAGSASVAAQEKLQAARQLEEAQRTAGERGAEHTRRWRDLVLEALRSDPGYFEAWIELADAEQQLAFLSRDGAEKQTAIDRGYVALRRALQLQPDSAEALSAMSWLQLREGRNTEALALNLSLLERSPNSHGSMRAAGIALWQLLRPAEALVLQERALALDPLSPPGARQRGLSLILLGQLDDARENHVAAIERAPTFAAFYNDLAYIEGAARGEWEESTRWLLRGVSALPTDIGIADTLAQDLQALGLDEAAERWTRRVDAHRTARGRAEALARLRVLQGRYAEALAIQLGSGADQDARAQRDTRGTLALLHHLADDAAGAGAHLAAGIEELGGGYDDILQIGTARELHQAAMLGLVAMRSGDVRGPIVLRLALERVRKLPAQGHTRSGQISRYYGEAELLAALGETEAALAALEAALPKDGGRVLLNSIGGMYIGASPFLAALHDEPRYRALITEIERRRSAAARRVDALVAEHERENPP